ncbi:hypothetical protein [Qipengyuania atrilutea]|uniref:Uncharacterized protein n=1 Tax=Qipengyuania atrilutea TaxID=2744473 RepID=A0A850GVU9_9SPHN|nr:hypothetical protein [Actirhodobacter atriluteus]NVD43654.1 hypothetical protein [Actirhodobacter atriluteus]
MELTADILARYRRHCMDRRMKAEKAMPERAKDAAITRGLARRKDESAGERELA